MDRPDLLARRGAARADRPDRLVGDDEALRSDPLGQTTGELGGEPGIALTRQIFGLGLADAQHDEQTRRARRTELGADERIGFAEPVAAFGMAEDDRLRPGIGEHGRRHAARERPARPFVAILAAHQDRRVLDPLGHGVDQGEGREDPERAGEPDRPFGERAGQRQALGPEPVHLPIAEHHRPIESHRSARRTPRRPARRTRRRLASTGPPALEARGRSRRLRPPPALAYPPPLTTSRIRVPAMLDALRRQATGWVVKSFLVLLIVSFAIWGIGDVLRGPKVADEIARVGGEPLPSSEVVRDTERNFRRLREEFGQEVERSPAVMENLFRQALAQAIARRLLERHARELDLTIAPTTLARLVREDPTFAGPEGFDRRRFELVLREAGLSEAGYLELLRGDVLRSRLVEAMTGALVAPELLVRELARYREERRVGRALVVSAAAQDPGPPDEATLTAWLERNAARFRVPELRAVELVVLGVEDLLAESLPSEEELRAAYEERRAAYTTPEERTATQLLAADRAVIEEVERLAREGKSFAEIASTLEGRGLTVSTLGPVAAGVLPDPLDKALRALAPGELSEPLQTPFGWHLLRLERVTPAVTKPFEEVKEALAEELARRRAADRLPEVAERLDDALAAGEDLAAAARAVGARHLRLPAVDAQGRDGEGRAIDGIEFSPEMLQEIAATPAGRTSLLVHGKDDRWFVVKVESVIPPRDRRLEEVRVPVEIGWKLERQRELARERATALLGRVRAGETLVDLARAEPGLELAPIGPLRRRGDPEPLGPAVTRALFSTPPGRIAEEPVPTPEGFALVATDEIHEAPAELDLAPVRRELRESLGEAMVAAYEQALRRRFPVATDERAIARIVESFGR